MIPREQITGLVLAGGQGRRMDGRDKGLALFAGVPLALHAARRLAPQVGALRLSANRNLDTYAAFGWPVLPDTLPDHPGPLAGMLTALQHCGTPWLASVPCDSPLFPADLVARLAQAAALHAAPLAVALAPVEDGALRRQPAFLLMHRTLAPSLASFLAEGGRKVGAWLALHACAEVAFGPPLDAPGAFANANTLAELRALDRAAPG